MTNKMVSQAIRLWFHFLIHFREDKYESRYFVKKRSSGYKEQQIYQNTQRYTIDKKSQYRSRDSNF